jgi:hypothetical protein
MFKETLRVFAVFLMLIIIIMDDFPFYNKLKDQNTQLFLGTFVICTLYYDTVLGFILALVLMLIYYEIYKKIKVKKNIVNTIEHYTKSNNPDGNVGDNKTETIAPRVIPGAIPVDVKKECDFKLNYISEEHLLAAQNNIFDANNYTTEVKGIEKGYNEEKVYGAQGLDSESVNLLGYDTEDRFTTL